jgi:hypothetical protein
MTGSNVRVLPALEPGESYTDPNFLMVETVRNKRGELVSNIDHVKTRRAEAAGWSVTPLCRAEAMSHAEAMEWAVAYAATNSIPVVYTRDETAGGDELPGV